MIMALAVLCVLFTGVVIVHFQHEQKYVYSQSTKISKKDEFNDGIEHLELSYNEVLRMCSWYKPLRVYMRNLSNQHTEEEYEHYFDMIYYDDLQPDPGYMNYKIYNEFFFLTSKKEADELKNKIDNYVNSIVEEKPTLIEELRSYMIKNQLPRY